MFEKTKKATIILGNIKTQKLAADKNRKQMLSS